jgi:hypothetical protein
VLVASKAPRIVKGMSLKSLYDLSGGICCI